MALDPLTTATTFATIVSLISDFRNEHNKVAIDDHQKFLEWLSDNRHDEIKNILEQNQETIISIKAILNQDYEIVFQKLQSIDSKLASLLSEDMLFSKLVEAISPEQALSKQAVAVLIQFERSQASEMLERRKCSDGTSYMFIDGLKGQLNYTEPRFIQDDLGKLIELGLLRLRRNKEGDNVFEYTRRASDFVSSIEG